MDGIKLFNQVINQNIIDNTKYLKGRSNYMTTFFKVKNKLSKQQIKREELKKENLIVPPLFIISVTNDCNLKCHGCYANSQERKKNLN